MKIIAVKTKMKTIMACRVRAGMVKKEMKKDLTKTKRVIMIGNTSRNIPAVVLAACNTTRIAACMAWAINTNRNMSTIMILNRTITGASKIISKKANTVAGHKGHRETGAWAWAEAVLDQVPHAVASQVCPKKKFAV